MESWRKFIWSFGLALIAITIVVLYRNEVIDNNVLFAGLAVSISLYLGVVRIKVDHDRIFKELFTEFNNRYSYETNELLNKLRQNNSDDLSPEERLKIIDYFNLCSEEYLWYKKGRIPKDVWKAWKSGIIENLKISAVKKLYDEETDNPVKVNSFYGLVTELKRSNKISNHKDQSS